MYVSFDAIFLLFFLKWYYIEKGIHLSQIIIFLLLGIVLGYIFKSYRKFESTYYTKNQFKNMQLTPEAIAKSELGLFVALAAKIAKADGKVHELEAELISNMLKDVSQAFEKSEEVRDILKEIFNREKEIVFNVDELALELQQRLRGDKQKALMMLQFLTHLSFIDGELSHTEERLLLKIAAFLKIEHHEIEGLINHFASMHNGSSSSMSEGDAYKLLEVDEGASLSEIKKAYRKLVKKYHPDIMQAKGESEEYIKEATAKVQEINEAYELLKTKYV